MRTQEASLLYRKVGVMTTAGASLLRGLESFVINLIVAFLVLASGILGSVDLTDHKAILTALTIAFFRALIVAAQEFTGASVARVTSR